MSFLDLVRSLGEQSSGGADLSQPSRSRLSHPPHPHPLSHKRSRPPSLPSSSAVDDAKHSGEHKAAPIPPLEPPSSTTLPLHHPLLPHNRQLTAPALLQRSSPHPPLPANPTLAQRWSSRPPLPPLRTTSPPTPTVFDVDPSPSPIDSDEDDDVILVDSKEEKQPPPSLSHPHRHPIPLSLTHPPAPPPRLSMHVRVSMSVVPPDYTPILSMGYTLRQAAYATRLCHDDVDAALDYLLDMDGHRDELEIQIVQAELETEDRERREGEEGERRKGVGQGAGGGGTSPAGGRWLRLFPRFTSLSQSISTALDRSSSALSRSSSQPTDGADARRASARGVRSPSPSPSPSPSACVGEDEAGQLSRVALHPPVPSPPPRPTDPFECAVCTYINCEGEAECAMCGTARPAGEKERAWQASLRPCGICFDLLPLSSMCTATSPCGHLFCWPCSDAYIVSRVEDNRVLGLSCPHPGCGRPLLDGEVHSTLSPYHYHRYRRFRLRAQLEADPRVRYCPDRRCQAVMYGSTEQPRMQCGACGMESCFVCGIAWHEGLTCLQVLRQTDLRGPTAEDVAFLQTMHAEGQGTKYRQCPRCSAWVERAAGCAKMTCRCGAQWCFECGVANATCNCTARYHSFYPLQTVLNNWNQQGPG